MQGIPSVGVCKELIELFAIYGAVEEWVYVLIFKPSSHFVVAVVGVTKGKLLVLSFSVQNIVFILCPFALDYNTEIFYLYVSFFPWMKSRVFVHHTLCQWNNENNRNYCKCLCAGHVRRRSLISIGASACDYNGLGIERQGAHYLSPSYNLQVDTGKWKQLYKTLYCR